MRAPIVGLYCAGHLDRLDECTRRSAVVTHTHPLAIEGAVIIARATAAVVLGHPTCDVLSEASTCCVSDEFRSRLARAVEWLASKRDVERTEVRRSLGAGTAAHESCVTAVYLALRFRDGEFVDLQRFAAAMGGDVDTIGAMAGAIWGAANGVKRLPAELLDRLEQHEELATLAARLHQSANA